MVRDSISRTSRSLIVVVAALAALVFAGTALSSAAANTPAKTPAFASYKPAGPGMGARPVRASKLLNVVWRPGVPAAQRAAAARALGFRVVQSSARLGWTQVEPTRRGLSAATLEKRMRQLGLITTAQAARIYHVADVTPNDPQFDTQWALKNVGQLGGTPGADTGATRAWDTTTGGNIVVAVVDEGLNWAHPDLSANAWVNKGEIPNNGIDDDHNGYVDDVHGYDFYNDDSTTYDRIDGDRHGTHVAGIIGAAGDNGVGVSGVNWRVKIMPVKFLGPFGGDDFSGAMAIQYAVDNGAKVINCSWGGQGTSDVLQEAIDYAAEKNVLIVCAAGNDGVDVDSTPFFPGSSESTNVISVAATDRNDQLADFSNFGENGVDLAAPGVDVTSTLPKDLGGFFVDSPPYKLMYLPIQLESLEPAAQRDDLIARSVARVGALPSTPILVVDGSHSSETSDVPGERLGVYTSALSSAGYTSVSVWNDETQGAPTQSAMAGKVVVWFTGRLCFGWYPDPSVSTSDEAAIATYLDNGGRMVMSSGELADDMVGAGIDPEWFYSYFQCELVDYMTWTLEFKGKAGTPLEGIDAHLPASFNDFNPEDPQWPTGSDQVVPLTGFAPPPDGGGDPGDPGAGAALAVGDTPGVSTQLTLGEYGPLSGTSMAAPHVTGAAALLEAALPGASAEDVRARIIGSADPLPALDSRVASGGRLDIPAALGRYTAAPIVDTPKPLDKLHALAPTPMTWHVPKGSDPDATFTAQIGLPYLAWSEDFEGGNLGSLGPAEDTPWSASSATESVHGGSWGARSGVTSGAVDLGGGWAEMGTSSMQTTVTVPEGGADLSFWWKLHTPDFMQEVDFWVDDGSTFDFIWVDTDWTRASYKLSAGQHVLHWAFDNADFAGSGAAFSAVDDIALTAHTFSDIGGAGAGATELTFTPPSADTGDAWLRIRSSTPSRTSAWSYVRGLQISTDFAAPGPVTALSTVGDNDGRVNASWINPADVDFASTRVLRRTDTTPTGPGDPEAAVAYEGTGTAFTDGPMPTGRVHYAAYSQDFAGNWSAGTFSAANVFDTVAPGPVSLIDAEQFDGMVLVSWLPPDPATYDHVKVMRRLDATPTSSGDAQAEVIYQGPGALAVDFMLPGSADHAYYTVWAQDQAGNTSVGRSIRVDLDTVPPAGTMALDGGAQFTATPTVSVDSSVTGATEMRLFPNGEYDEEALWQPYSATATADLLAIDGSQSVLAEYRDSVGNTVQVTDDIYVDLTPPDAPENVAVTNFNDGAQVTWGKSADGSVVSYDLWQAPSETGPWTKVRSGMKWSPGGAKIGHLPTGVEVFYELSANDGVGHTSARSDPYSTIPGSGLVRVAGADRVRTAIAVSRQHFNTADGVVLVSANAPADALGAASLAGAMHGPLLMTGGRTLEASVLDEIDRLGASSVVVVGGSASVSGEVTAALAADGLDVERIAGNDRYGVAASVAKRVAAQVGEFDGTVIVASGEALADPIAASAIGYSQHIPVLLTRKIGAPTASISAAKFLGATSALAVGGPATLPEGAVTPICPQWRRIGGATRYDIAVNLANYAVAQGWASWNFVGIGSGTSPADALAGASAGSQRGVLLLTAPTALPSATDRAIRHNAASIGHAEMFGPSGVISAGVGNSVGKAMKAY